MTLKFATPHKPRVVRNSRMAEAREERIVRLAQCSSREDGGDVPLRDLPDRNASDFLQRDEIHH